MGATPVPTGTSGRSALEVARDGASHAGEIALRAFRKPHQVDVKGRGNFVTETDLEIEAYLTKTLQTEFPDHNILSEETASETDLAGWVWVIDPLDGTHNYATGIPFFCTNIALCLDGDPVVAVTHDPTHGETFWAERGRGAWLNDAPARASQVAAVSDAVFGIDLGYHDERGRAVLQLAHTLFPGVQCVRLNGSAALGLAYVAVGRYDVFLHQYLYPWDVAAGILLIREAGGTITDYVGGPVSLRTERILAGGSAVHGAFLRWQQEQGASLDLVATA